MRNIIVIGKRYSGKRTIIKNIFGEAEEEAKRLMLLEPPFHVNKTLLKNEKLYECDITVLSDHELDRSNIAKTSERISQLGGANLIIYVFREGHFIGPDKCIFQKYTDIFKNTRHSISALVFTNCESKNIQRRTELVEKFKSDEVSRDYAASMGKGIHTVGFPSLGTADDCLKEFYKKTIQEDVKRLHQLIEESSDVVQVQKVHRCCCYHCCHCSPCCHCSYNHGCSIM